ncbi:MAG: hypothetical protein R3C10_20420 [Pirellulales bacterium]
MKHARRNWPEMLLCAVAMFVGSGELFAQEDATREGGSTAASQPLSKEEIKVKLAEMTDLEFVEAELIEVAQTISRRHHMPVVLDRPALEDAGLGVDLPVTESLAGLRLDTALDLLLRDAELTYIVQDGHLLITTAEHAAKMLETRVYSVGDLLDHVGGSATMDELIDTVQATIAPSTWDIVGGNGSIQALGNLLVIAQSQRTHRAIDDLLEKLRAAPISQTQASASAVPEGRSAWEMRVYSTHGLVAAELKNLLYTLLPDLADVGTTRLFAIGHDDEKPQDVEQDSTLADLGMPQGDWLVVGQRPGVHDRLAELLGEGKLIDERRGPPVAVPLDMANGSGGFGGGGGGGFGGGGFGGGGFF